MCVLLVEDDALIAMIVEEALLVAGYEVALASNGPEAVELLHRRPRRFVALVSNYHTQGQPTGTGLIELARRIYPHISSIIATDGSDVIGSAWLQANNVQLIAKPFHSSALVALLDGVLRPRNA